MFEISKKLFLFQSISNEDYDLKCNHRWNSSDGLVESVSKFLKKSKAAVVVKNDTHKPKQKHPKDVYILTENFISEALKLYEEIIFHLLYHFYPLTNIQTCIFLFASKMFTS